MWNEPDRETLAELPGLGVTDAIDPADKLIYLHFFIGDSDWYITEFNQGDVFWGFAILGANYFNAGWGPVLFSDLKAMKIDGFYEVDCDLFWNVCPAREVDKILKARPYWAKSAKIG